MERNVYVVTYDIADDRRRTAVYQYLRGWGDHLQYSVFRLVLHRADRMRVRTTLHDLIDHGVDQVLFLDLGPFEGRARGSVDAIGVAYTHPERHAVVV
ncbi:MAG: CRISPR-associated endonuclease Cas2 [Deltaproteobacteria bacterium]|nr:MAG: CRISPR-associated endonuclease Cas2 [Deltaproteobacteria bacterium]